MVRWQYRVVNIGAYFAHERLVQTLGALGQDGWELVTIYDKASNWFDGMEKGFALFKRAVPDGEEPIGPWASAGATEEQARDAEQRRLAQNQTRIQKLLDDRAISAPGAASALAPIVPHAVQLDGAARLGSAGDAGVIIVTGRTAALWWSEDDAVELVALRAFTKVTRVGLELTLIRNEGPPVTVLAAHERYADSWIKTLAGLGAVTQS
jgi:hypothetical protein